MDFRRLMNWILGKKDPEESVASARQSERRVSPRLNYSDGVVHIIDVGEFPLIDLAQGGLALDIKKF